MRKDIGGDFDLGREMIIDNHIRFSNLVLESLKEASKGIRFCQGNRCEITSLSQSHNHRNVGKSIYKKDMKELGLARICV